MAEKCIEKAEQTCKSYPNCYGCNAYRNPTNYDRIRNMSVVEMARFLSAYMYSYKLPPEVDFIWRNNQISIFGALKQWLESEVANDDT